jgi:uncharacterized membrane protein YeaQ/YmgE (transglycosylase-associated protein family)
MADNSTIAGLIGALLFIVLVGALGPTMFANLTIAGAPSWVSTTLPIVVGAGLVLAVWKMFS